MNGVQADKMVPLYQQLYDTIRRQIELGEYRPGDKIPSEARLSEIYGISRITVRSALQHLVDENILVKKHGKGTFVAMPAYVESMSAGGSFTESWLQTNVVPGTKLISLSVEPSVKKIADILEAEPGSKVICIKRLRLVDDLAAIFEVDYFRSDFDFLLHANLENASILELIREHTGLVLKEFNDIFEVKHANKEHAAYLDCVLGSPLLRVSQTVMTDQLRVMYYNEQYIRSDRYKYAVRSY